MRKLLSCGVLLLASQITMAPPPTVIPVQNPTFEEPVTFQSSNSCGAWAWRIPGWTAGTSTGIFQPANPALCGIAVAPDGAPVAYAGSGGTFSQTLTMSPADVQEYKPGYTVDGVYVLTFSVANYFPSYPGYFIAEVSFGTQELCKTSGWGTKVFTQMTVTCPGPGYIVVDKSLSDDGTSGPVQGTNKFVIQFTANGWPVMFHKTVSLTFAPAS
jgi:hypothetical protein